MRPLLRRLPITLVRAPPLSLRLSGSGRTERSVRCAAAVRMTSWVSLSRVMGWSPSLESTIALLRPRAPAATAARGRAGASPESDQRFEEIQLDLDRAGDALIGCREVGGAEGLDQIRDH